MAEQMKPGQMHARCGCEMTPKPDNGYGVNADLQPCDQHALSAARPDHKVLVDLEDMLDVVVAADGYGYGDAVLMEAFGTWLKGMITEEVIEAHLARLTLPYTDEDRQEHRERLERFRARWAS